MKDGTVRIIEHGRDEQGRPAITEADMDRSTLPSYLGLAAEADRD